MFRLIAPTLQWHSRYADSHTAPRPKIERSADRIVIRYPTLGKLPVFAEVVVETPAGGGDIRFTLKVRNDGDGDITDVLFPWLGGWTGVGGRGRDRMTVGGGFFADPHDFPKNRGLFYLRTHQRQFYYSVYFPCSWLDLSGPPGGLSYIVYYPEARAYGFAVENLAGYRPGLRLALGLSSYTLIRPGKTWTSPTVALSVHDGDWHDTATGEAILELFHQLHRQGRTIAIVTHDPEIAGVANRQIEIRDGRIVKDTGAATTTK